MHPKTPASPGFKLAIDFGPLIVFFLLNLWAPGPALARLLAATAGFMVASVVAMLVSRWRTGHVSPMLWISGSLVLVFGGLTLYFHNGNFIKMKPTVVYTMFALMAVLNEYVWRTTSPNPGDDASFWAGFKLWGAIPLTLAFALANVPMLLRHGLSEAGAAAELPPEG